MVRGSKALWCALALLFAAALPADLGESEAGQDTTPELVRTMVVILDAVPLGTVENVLASQTEGERLFEGFQPVRPLVSTFPSSTSVAMGGLLEPFELPRSPGYEARFFDWEELKVRGGGAISFFRIDFAWRDFFDWSRKGVVRSAFGGLRPVSASGTRLQKSVDAFFRSPKDTYFIYLETTDLAAHLKGPAALEEVMVWLDGNIKDVRRRFPESPFRTVIFSDHGVEGSAEAKLENVLPVVREALASGGFRVTKKLAQPNDVVLTPFGLVSSLEAYTDPTRAQEVGSRLASAVGVDLCVYRSQEAETHFWVVDEVGGAEIVRGLGADGDLWSYSPEDGDPLEYASVVAALGAGPAGELAFPDDRWFEQTADHFYPDALYRIVRAFELVENPATVLCSLEPGFMYGAKSTERLAKVGGSTVRWTHGALHRDATVGFLLTDDERFVTPGPLRFDRALVPLTFEREPEASTSRGADQHPVQRDKMPSTPPIDEQGGQEPAVSRPESR